MGTQVVPQVPLHTAFFAHFFASRWHGDGCHGDDVMTLRHVSNHDVTVAMTKVSMVTTIATTAWSPVRVQKKSSK